MLPDIKKPSGIGKTVQVNFGGVDLRPEAGDGSFARTVNLTSDKLPLLASRPLRRVIDSEGQIHYCDLYGMGDGIIENRDGFFSYNGFQIAQADVQGGGTLIPFGNKIILPWSREIIDLTQRPKGAVGTVNQLPADAAEGDVYATSQTGHFYKRENGTWVDLGCMVKSLEARAELTDPTFCDGYYQGEKAEMNEIRIDNGSLGPDSGVDFRELFRPGDAVTISGCVWQDRNNETLIVREVTANALRFYENSFRKVDWYVCYVEETLQDRNGAAYLPVGDLPAPYQDGTYIGFDSEVAAGSVVIVQRSPELPEVLVMVYNPNGADGWERISIHDEYEYQMEHPEWPRGVLPREELRFLRVNAEEIPIQARDGVRETSGCVIERKWPENIRLVFADSNRLWGWDGKQIRCCKLGDPSNWDFFDGTAEDSWAVEVHDPDPFTGGISVHGYPSFYTEHRRYRVYGSEPEAYQLGEQDCSGVRAGCEKSLAAIDGALYYVSRAGIMQDTGGVPACVSEALGLLRLSQAVGAGHQQRYYVTGRDQDGQLHNLILDTRIGAWIDEGCRNVVSYAEAAGVMHEADIDTEDGDRLTIRAYEPGSPMGDGSQEPAQSSVAETNDFSLSQPNRKRVHRVQLRFVIGSGTSLTVAIRYDSSGPWVTVKQLQGDSRKRSVYLPVLPRRCDHFRLRFEADGDWELHSLALDLRQGSAVF